MFVANRLGLSKLTMTSKFSYKNITIASNLYMYHVILHCVIASCTNALHDHT
jgi:hypothetical protein